MKKVFESDIQPFKMCENIYFVGSTKVSVHIIETDEGLVMLDTGYPNMYEQILNSMEALGLDPKNICAIFHTHGHIDHFGCTEKFKKLSGAKTYISRIDNDIVNGKLDLSWAKELGLPTPSFFDCDVLIEDADCFSFGNVTIRCRLTPGHTDGVLSFFITVPSSSKSLVAAMHGGVGLNSMTTPFLTAYNLPFTCRDTFRNGLHALADERVDIVLGNHPQQNDTQGKLNKVLSGESIVDHDEWVKFLTTTECAFDHELKNGL